MKVLYSQIKQYLPQLKLSPDQTGQALTRIGFLMDGLEEINYQNKKDFLISLEVRQNRPDCLSVFGLVKEIAVYLGLKAELPKIKKFTYSAGSNRLHLKINAEKEVRRVIAGSINSLKNKLSPAWLKEILALWGMNSINLVVDLSNYVMFLTGYPSHIIDQSKISGDVFWSINRKGGKVITTLDGSKIKLQGGELVIRDEQEIIALAGIVGTKYAEVDLKSSSILLEMAVYQGELIHQNSRGLSITTEASNRLEKNLSPAGMDYAFNLLIGLILEHCEAELSSKLFDSSPCLSRPSRIKFDPLSPSDFAGKTITRKEVISILKNLGCRVQDKGANLLISPPLERSDLVDPEDLVEEVVRLYGYDKIAVDQIPQFRLGKDITPPVIYLIEKVKNILVDLGLDEVLSQPLTKIKSNQKFNYYDWGLILAENAVNEELPELRQSIAVGLFSQFKEYLKNNLQYINIFEIGKVFGKKENQYLEHYSLGILLCAEKGRQALNDLKAVVEKILRSLGIKDIIYPSSKIKPWSANPFSCWDIWCQGLNLGILYKLKPFKKEKAYLAEINLSLLCASLQKMKPLSSVVEIKIKNVVLDANIELKKDKSIDQVLGSIKKKIKQDHLWSLEIIDVFPLPNKIRYTVRATYKNLRDQEAKKIHLSVFQLKSVKSLFGG